MWLSECALIFTASIEGGLISRKPLCHRASVRFRVIGAMQSREGNVHF
jgi:hypothetical protein